MRGGRREEERWGNGEIGVGAGGRKLMGVVSDSFLFLFFFNKGPNMSKIHLTRRQLNVVKLSYTSAW